MPQYEVLERKSRGTAHHKSDIFQKKRNVDRRFSYFGSGTDTSQTVQGMQIKYRAGEKPVTPVIQMNITNAQAFRQIAYNIAASPDADYTDRTVGVSNNMFAISPMLRGNRQQSTAQARSGNRQHAGPVPGGNQSGNHAERKLIFHDGGLTEIGVNRPICTACANAIRNAANIAHVSDPNGTYSVTPNGLVRVAN